MKKLKNSFFEALEQLWFHKLRTLLTLLGMIFGVGAVIAMVSVGEGAQKEALSLIDSMGMRNILVQDKNIWGERLREVRKHSLGLSLQDVEASMETLPFALNFAAAKKLRLTRCLAPTRMVKARSMALLLVLCHCQSSRLTMAVG